MIVSKARTRLITRFPSGSDSSLSAKRLVFSGMAWTCTREPCAALTEMAWNLLFSSTRNARCTPTRRPSPLYTTPTPTTTETTQILTTSPTPRSTSRLLLRRSHRASKLCMTTTRMRRTRTTTTRSKRRITRPRSTAKPLWRKTLYRSPTAKPMGTRPRGKKMTSTTGAGTAALPSLPRRLMTSTRSVSQSMPWTPRAMAPMCMTRRPMGHGTLVTRREPLSTEMRTSRVCLVAQSPGLSSWWSQLLVPQCSSPPRRSPLLPWTPHTRAEPCLNFGTRCALSC
mmetsp:Transcript_28045/g.66845  ORF Transcript_28045/g.66845 Transcript_28045/m.66845 type:complete len:283 (-) Transcript_28045:82-930(-)